MSTMSADFARQVLAVSVAQMLSRLNFGAAETHALDTLVEVTGLFIETIGRRAALVAEHDGRSLVAFEDLLLAFEDLERSIDWKDLKKMCQQLRWDVPFTKGIPDFPVDKLVPQHQTGNGTNAAFGEADTSEPAGAPHGGDLSIPSFFPAFPPAHTYQHTAVNEHVAVADAGKARKRALDIRLQVRSALAKIHKAEALKSATSSKNAPGGGELFGATKTDAATLAAAGPGAGSVRPPSSVITALITSGNNGSISGSNAGLEGVSTAGVGASTAVPPQPIVFLKINKAQAEEAAAAAEAIAIANSKTNESVGVVSAGGGTTVNLFTATPRKVHVGRRTSMMSGGSMGKAMKQPMALERSMTREDRLIDGLEVDDDDENMDIATDGPSTMK